jgi:hypothetical protein
MDSQSSQGDLINLHGGPGAGRDGADDTSDTSSVASSVVAKVPPGGGGPGAAALSPLGMQAGGAAGLLGSGLAGGVSAAASMHRSVSEDLLTPDTVLLSAAPAPRAGGGAGGGLGGDLTGFGSSFVAPGSMGAGFGGSMGAGSGLSLLGGSPARPSPLGAPPASQWAQFDDGSSSGADAGGAAGGFGVVAAGPLGGPRPSNLKRPPGVVPLLQPPPDQPAPPPVPGPNRLYSEDLI